MTSTSTIHVSEAILADDTRQWCYLHDRDSEEAFGPFESREAAIAAARKHGLRSIVLSRCNWADPGDCDVIGDQRDLLEKLDDATDEELRNPFEGTYSLRLGADPQELRDLVAVWLRKNVKTEWFCSDPDAFEDVDLCKEAA